MPQSFDYNDLEKDVRGAYTKLSSADDRKQSVVATLQKLARAFLKWDDDADKAVRRELQNFADMSLSEEAVSWYSEQAFRNCFVRALVSADMKDPARPENSGGQSKDGEYMGSDSADEWAKNVKVRTAFREAIGTQASDERVQAALRAAK
jgi:hypothetical protein